MIVYIVAIVTLLLLHYHGKRNLHMGHIIYVLTYTLQDATGKEEFTLTISKEGKAPNEYIIYFGNREEDHRERRTRRNLVAKVMQRHVANLK